MTKSRGIGRGVGGGYPKGLRHTPASREAIAEGARVAWDTRGRKVYRPGKRGVLELNRLITAQAKDARNYRVTGREFWDVYRIEPDTYPPRETHRSRVTSETGWDDRENAA